MTQIKHHMCKSLPPPHAPRQNCHYVEDTFVTAFTVNCHFDSFQHSPWIFSSIWDPRFRLECRAGKASDKAGCKFIEYEMKRYKYFNQTFVNYYGQIKQWASCQIRKIAGAHALGMPGTFSPSLQVSDPDMHHGTCVTHVPWCMPGSLTSSFLWNRRRGKTFPAFPAHAQPAILRIW